MFTVSAIVFCAASTAASVYGFAIIFSPNSESSVTPVAMFRAPPESLNTVSRVLASWNSRIMYSGRYASTASSNASVQ